MKTLKQLFPYISFILLLNSCEVSKKLFQSKTKTDTLTTSTETGKITTKKKGDTITYSVPNVTFKDTVITIPSYKNNSTGTLKVIYDKEGKQQIQCLESEMDIIKEYVLQQQEEKTELQKIKDKEKETIISPVNILYIFIGLAFLILFTRILKKFGI